MDRLEALRTIADQLANERYDFGRVVDVVHLGDGVAEVTWEHGHRALIPAGALNQLLDAQKREQTK